MATDADAIAAAAAVEHPLPRCAESTRSVGVSKRQRCSLSRVVAQAAARPEPAGCHQPGPDLQASSGQYG